MPTKPVAPQPEKVSVSKLVVKTEKPKVEKTVAEVHPVDVKAVVKQVPSLPHTGTKASLALVLAGVGALALAGASLKKKED